MSYPGNEYFNYIQLIERKRKEREREREREREKERPLFYHIMYNDYIGWDEFRYTNSRRENIPSV